MLWEGEGIGEKGVCQGKARARMKSARMKSWKWEQVSAGDEWGMDQSHVCGVGIVV